MARSSDGARDTTAITGITDTNLCGLRRRRHLRLPTDNRTCGCQPHSPKPLVHSLVARCNQLRYCLRLLGRYTRAGRVAAASRQLSVVESLPIHRPIRLGVKQFQLDEFLTKTEVSSSPNARILIFGAMLSGLLSGGLCWAVCWGWKAIGQVDAGHINHIATLAALQALLQILGRLVCFTQRVVV